MHEMSLAEGVLQICEDYAREAGAEKITMVRVEIGTLGHVEPEALSFCFDAVTAGTLAQGARLEIDRVPGRAWCRSCAREVEITSLIDACPVCGGFDLEVTGGEEMRVKNMEVT